MYTKHCFIGLGMVLLINFSACDNTNQESNTETMADATHTSKNSIDWAGTYVGVLPCADCEGIEIRIQLGNNETYVMHERYLGKQEEAIMTNGIFLWSEDEGKIILGGEKEGYSYQVGENKLTQLDMEGNMITGNLAAQYVLEKISDPFYGKKWELIELRGRPIEVNGMKETPYLIAEEAIGKIAGFAGCNRFFGSYNLYKANRLQFSHLGATQMFCEQYMHIEADFLNVLETTDNYYIHGDTLQLNKARMAPLAKLVMVTDSQN